jgi:hypothetical protein
MSPAPKSRPLIPNAALPATRTTPLAAAGGAFHALQSVTPTPQRHQRPAARAPFPPSADRARARGQKDSSELSFSLADDRARARGQKGLELFLNLLLRRHRSQAVLTEGRRPTMSYYVYENWQAGHRARVHHAECSYCKHGQGVHPGAGDKNGKWYGPFTTVDAARAAPLRYSGAVRRPCGHCRPY